MVGGRRLLAVKVQFPVSWCSVPDQSRLPFVVLRKQPREFG